MSNSIEQETINYAIAALALFGGPLAAFFAYLKFDDIKYRQAQKDKADKEFLEIYGQDAYNDMLKKRALNKASALATASNGPGLGIWYSCATADKLFQLIEINHPEALIGNSPHRLTEFAVTGSSEISLSGQWPYPKNPHVTSTVILNLQAQPMSDGRTGVKYRYSAAPADDPFAKQIIEITNFWLKDLIERAC